MTVDRELLVVESLAAQEWRRHRTECVVCAVGRCNTGGRLFRRWRQAAKVVEAEAR